MAPNDKPEEGPSTQPAAKQSEDRVIPPAYWMEAPDGAVFAASTEIDRVNLESAGYRVAKSTPKGMPSATGGVEK